MEALSLLDRAMVEALRVEVAGDDLVLKGPRSCLALVKEIGRRKTEVIAELRARTSTGDPAAWNTLAGQRWGGAASSPGIDISADSWRWEVAGWPIERWLTWRRRVDALLEPRAKLPAIRAAERRAYEEMTRTESVATPPRVRIECEPLCYDEMTRAESATTSP